MPRSNPLSFLRPLYDIAVWQFVLMCGRTRSDKLKFTWKMHEVVANFLCKMLEMPAFNHLLSKIEEETAQEATGNWKKGERATKKMVDWCQDQWRRKNLILPAVQTAFAVNEPSTMPWNSSLPVCHACASPCPNCKEELGVGDLHEMGTYQAILDSEAADSETQEEQQVQGSLETPPVSRRLRKRK